MISIPTIKIPTAGSPTTQTMQSVPINAVSMVIALLVRNLSFIWLTLLIVLAEFLIVITRFVFSYEQAFMGDLVRFWYAALFLFASAYTLVQEGHVRVDIIYTNFSPRGKAWPSRYCPPLRPRRSRTVLFTAPNESPDDCSAKGSSTPASTVS